MFKLNNKTTSVKISNIPQGVTPETLQSHFEQFGSVVKCGKTLGGDVVMEFGDRQTAEQAIIKGKKINDDTLQMQWNFGS